MGMRKRYSVKNIITEFAYDHRNMQKKVRKVHESAKELSNLLDKMEEKAEKRRKSNKRNNSRKKTGINY